MGRITVEMITDLLNEFCDHEEDITSDTELLESGMLDSLAFIELLNALEDMEVRIYPTQHPRGVFSTPRTICELCDKILAAEE